MVSLSFEWDDGKNRANMRKHGVSFEEARTVFFDDRAVEFYDDEHSLSEERFLLLGVSMKLRVLVVCHCVRERGNIIRIIAARKATKREQREYPWTGT